MSAKPEDARDVPSPCNKVCVLDAASGRCTGCLRTLEEIARWGAMTNAERRSLVEELSRRREASGGSAD